MEKTNEDKTKEDAIYIIQSLLGIASVRALTASEIEYFEDMLAHLTNWFSSIIFNTRK